MRDNLIHVNFKETEDQEFMKTEKIVVEFEQEELEKLLTEMFKSYDVEKKLYDSYSREYNKEEDNFLKDFRYKERELRIQFYLDMIEKLAPFSEEVTMTKIEDN